MTKSIAEMIRKEIGTVDMEERIDDDYKFTYYGINDINEEAKQIARSLYISR